MVLFLIVLPLALIALVAVVALVSVGRSSLRITTHGVEIRNYRQPERVVPLERVDRFEDPPPVGNFTGIRPRTAVLVLTDGTRLPVRCISDPDAGTGTEALNARLRALRRSGPA